MRPPIGSIPPSGQSDIAVAVADGEVQADIFVGPPGPEGPAALAQTVQAITASGGPVTIDMSHGHYVRLALNADIAAITVTNWPQPPYLGRLVLEIKNAGEFQIGGYPAGTSWPGGFVPSLLANGTSIFMIYSSNGGEEIFASVIR